ncbi:MAG: hypothetical protein F6K24_10220 [Okeania sp. SIO2D1]|nr:hypothetical protein [Okeania sp. SIO2D1]
MMMNVKQAVAATAVSIALVGGVTLAPQRADAQAQVPPNVQSGIDNAIATVQALDGLALAALVVALTPLGAMLTLRFLNMVLSRV